MAEYYTVLKKAIGGLDSNQAEARRTVYDKARNALIGQLKAVDPPLTTAEISRQRLELEEAIRKVEREAAANPAPVRAPARPAAAPPPAPSPVRMAPVPMPASEPADEGGPSPQDVFRRAIQEAESRGSAAGAAAGAIERAANVMRAEANQYGGANADLRPPRDRVVERALPPPAPMPRDEPPVEEYDPRDRAPPEPRLAPEYAQDWDNRSADTPSVDRRDRPNLPARRKRGYLEEDDRQALEREARPSRLPSLLLTILIVAVIGGAGGARLVEPHHARPDHRGTRRQETRQGEDRPAGGRQGRRAVVEGYRSPDRRRSAARQGGALGRAAGRRCRCRSAGRCGRRRRLPRRRRPMPA